MSIGSTSSLHCTRHRKLIVISLIIMMLIATSLAFPTLVSAQTASAQERAMHFVENMLPIDLSKYTITLISDFTMDGVPLTNINRNMQFILYELTSADSDLNVRFSFEKGIMTSCGITSLRGQIIVTKQYANPLVAAKDFLEKYQSYTKIDSSNFRVLLNNVEDVTKDSTLTTENAKLEIQAGYFGDTYETTFRWRQVINGADYNTLYFTFDDRSNIISIGDTRLLYTIGDTAINISLEQAVDIAIANLGTYSYAMPDGAIVKDFKVSKDLLMIELLVGPVDYDSYVLRPYWDIRLYLDEVYPGNVFGITVFVCANTGEIISYSNMATGGINYTDGPTPTSSAVGSEPKSNTLLIGTAAIAVGAIAVIGMLIYRKKHK